MQIKRRQLNGFEVLDITGEINFDTSPVLRNTFIKLIGEKKNKVIINFNGVSYIDSSGLATLVELLQKIKSHSGVLRLCNINPKVKSVFEVTKLDKIFEILSCEEDALK